MMGDDSVGAGVVVNIGDGSDGSDGYHLFKLIVIPTWLYRCGTWIPPNDGIHTCLEVVNPTCKVVSVFNLRVLGQCKGRKLDRRDEEHLDVSYYQG